MRYFVAGGGAVGMDPACAVGGCAGHGVPTQHPIFIFLTKAPACFPILTMNSPARTWKYIFDPSQREMNDLGVYR